MTTLRVNIYEQDLILDSDKQRRKVVLAWPQVDAGKRGECPAPMWNGGAGAASRGAGYRVILVPCEGCVCVCCAKVRVS